MGIHVEKLHRSEAIYDDLPRIKNRLFEQPKVDFEKWSTLNLELYCNSN